MGKQCLVLGDKGAPYPLVEQLWDAMLWYYVEENVTEFVVEQHGRLSNLVQYIINRVGERYPALQYTYLELRADIKTEIGKNEFLIIYPERSSRMKRFMAYAQQREEKGLMEVTVLEGK